MKQFIVQRFIYMLFTLFLVSILGFILVNLPPGTYIDVYISELEAQGTTTSLTLVESLKQRYGLNDPIYVQYWKWISGFVVGDFGFSFLYRAPVRDLIGERLMLTMVIAISAMIFSWAVAIPLGIYSAVHQYSRADYFLTFIGFIGLSIPNFLLALVLLVLAHAFFGVSLIGLFSEEYMYAPWSFGKVIDLLKHLWVPVIVVGTDGTASLMRIMRGNLLDVLNAQYVTTARSKGISENRVIYKHAVRNALHPLIMQFGVSFPNIISGATVVAIVLSLPTSGPLYFSALRSQDMYLAVTFLMFLALMLLIGNLVADFLLAWIDPRIRFD